MQESEEKSRSGDVEAWVTIAVINAVATAVVFGLYICVSGAMS